MFIEHVHAIQFLECVEFQFQSFVKKSILDGYVPDKYSIKGGGGENWFGKQSNEMNTKRVE